MIRSKSSYKKSSSENSLISLSYAKKLISLARRVIRSALYDEKVLHDAELKLKYPEKRGVFVSIHKKSELRGCIGFPEPVYGLYEAVGYAAKYAAFEDPRFPPMTIEEYPDISLELSILTIPKEIKIRDDNDLKKIQLGTHGLIIRSPSGSGLLLPQVFVEYPCDAEGALNMTCRKAGLSSGFWKKNDCEIYLFSAQVFLEKNGSVVEMD